MQWRAARCNDLALLVTGASDIISVFIRSSLINFATLDPMRGRVGAVNMLFVGASGDLGEFESDPRFTAVFLFHGYHGIVDDARVLEKRLNRARLARRLVEVFFRTVGLDDADHSA
jgi:hypothetical protein